MLYTNLNHIENLSDFNRVVNDNENVAIVCGRMDRESVPVYRIAEELAVKYRNVKFFDIELDNPEMGFISQYNLNRNAVLAPFTILYRKGKVVQVVTGLNSENEADSILKASFFNSNN